MELEKILVISSGAGRGKSTGKNEEPGDDDIVYLYSFVCYMT